MVRFASRLSPSGEASAPISKPFRRRCRSVGTTGQANPNSRNPFFSRSLLDGARREGLEPSPPFDGGPSPGIAGFPAGTPGEWLVKFSFKLTESAADSRGSLRQSPEIPGCGSGQVKRLRNSLGISRRQGEREFKRIIIRLAVFLVGGQVAGSNSSVREPFVV